VPIREIIERKYGAVFEPDDVPHLVAGYEAALRKLGLVDRRDPRVVTVAKLIIGLAHPKLIESAARPPQLAASSPWLCKTSGSLKSNKPVGSSKHRGR
jgi:hypothetical protein